MQWRRSADSCWARRMAGYGLTRGSLRDPHSLPQFSRDAEREPTFSVCNICIRRAMTECVRKSFEKIEAEERRIRAIPKLFSTHPPTTGTVRSAGRNRTILPARDEYIVTLGVRSR